MSETTSKMHPLMAGAAVAVILFSAVGVGVMTGVIPSSKSSTETPVAPEPAVKAPATAAKGTASAPDKAVTPERKSSTAKHAPAPASRPAQVAMNDHPAAGASIPPPPPAPRLCTECGVIDAINVVEKKGDGSGLGAVGGAVVGGLLGNQVGKGRGNTAATVVGAVGGALAGNEVEKRVKSTSEYHVTVRMEGGGSRNFTFESAPGYTVGEKVKVIDGRLVKG